MVIIFRRLIQDVSFKHTGCFQAKQMRLSVFASLLIALDNIFQVFRLKVVKLEKKSKFKEFLLNFQRKLEIPRNYFKFAPIFDIFREKSPKN